MTTFKIIEMMLENGLDLPQHYVVTLPISAPENIQHYHEFEWKIVMQ